MRVALALFALVAVGCAPALTSSLRDRHYDDAICAASFAGSDSAARRVSRALASDLQAAVHLHAVTPEELERGLGGRLGRDPRRLLDEFQIVRLVYSANRLPTVGFDLSVAATSDGRPLRIAALGRYEDVLALTHEQPPTPRTTTDDGRAGAIAANVIFSPFLLVANLFSIPATGRAVYFRAHPRTVTLPLEDGDWRAGAPDTFRVRNAFVTQPCGDAMSRPCEAFIAIEHPLPSSDVSLDFALRFGPLPIHDHRDEPACVLDLHESVLLPAGAPLGTRVQAIFGDRQRTFPELGATHSATAELLGASR